MDGARTRGEIRVSAERGRRLFLDPARGCVHCHGGPALTISGRSAERSVFDVGTGKDVDTPTLLELWDTAPYLHDGRAATLHDVLTTHNRQDRHGKTSDLDAGQLADLANFLLAPSSEETP
jgi:cytochrome c peroxidase